MKIYKQEILDGISEQVESQASVAYVANIVLDLPDYIKAEKSLEETIASFGLSNPNQLDLYYLNCVLASTGWNLNDDVFSKSETWAARNTPVDKQFNYMHDDTDIIGHITGSMVFDKNGNRVESDEEPEEDFDIITSAVLYTKWRDLTQEERVKALISEIKEGKWAVSMECLFNDFDYAVIDSDGASKIVARNESSAFLTKHLRVYGGTGSYNNYRVGRVLKNIIFSGEGIVNQPANVRSIIIPETHDPFNEESNINLSVKEFAMSKDVEQTVDNSEFEAVIADLTATVAEKGTVISGLQDEVSQLNEEIAALKISLKETNEKLSNSEASIRDMKRANVLKDAGFSDEKITETMSKFASVDEESFAAMVELIKTSANVYLDQINTLKTATPVEVVEEVETVEAEVEVEDTVLEEVEEVEETVVVAEEQPDTRSEAMTAVAQWVRKDVLKTTRNFK